VYFPFIVIIERATLFDVASYLKAIRWADNHGYGKYSARNGKFQTDIWAVANGHPKFSILDILERVDCNEINNIKFNEFKGILDFEGTALLKDNDNSIKIEFKGSEDSGENEENKDNSVKNIEELENKFESEFEKYFKILIK